MGYPFNATLLHSFLGLLKELHSSSRIKNGKTEFYFPVLKKLLLHPYIKFSDIKLTYDLINLLTAGNVIYFDPVNNDIVKEILSKSDSGIPLIYDKIFNYTADSKSFHIYLKEIIKSIHDRIENSKTGDESYKKFQFEYLFHFYTNFNLLCGYINKQNIEININSFWKLLTEITSGIRIPFSGEPLQGMQIMGLLETRCLDFDNLFILSMNEGIFPKSSADLSFIPYVVRKYFHLPTFEDDDSVYAYYFFRLIQKAKNIFLFFDSETEKSSKGKSRFLLQIEKELIKINPAINYSEKSSTPGVVTFKILPIEITKSESVMTCIHKIERLSASALITAITCKLKFYLKYVVKLKEPDETEEEFQGATFGSIFHTLMQSLYENYTGKTLNVDVINGIKSKIENDFEFLFDFVLKKVSEKEKRMISLEQSPKNIMYKFVIKNLVQSTLENDLNYAPFNIISLENKFSKPFEVITDKEVKRIDLHGYIDRIDSKDNVIRIIDYKTGSPNYKELKDDESFFDEIFSNVKYKDSFQTLFYAYNHINSAEQKYKPVIYYVNENVKMVKDVKSTPLTPDDFDNFRTRLNKILTDIFNPDFPFIQTENPDNCIYCPFRDLCYRKQ
jgi:CRISPR/Cas system-associated exonuclease Cas4 (RecB family)